MQVILKYTLHSVFINYDDLLTMYCYDILQNIK